MKYADNIVEETKQVIAAHRASVLKGIDIILPRLKDGWVTQRGDIYQFGPSPSQEEPNRIDLMKSTKQLRRHYSVTLRRTNIREL